MIDPPGIDTARLAAFLDSAAPGLVAGPITATLIEGGRSNLTYVVTDGATRLVVRRPPLGHVLETAHDMSREYRVISALADTPVPVPVTYVLCEDAEVIGAPFYVMEWVAGTPYRSAADLEALGREGIAEVSRRMIETLATLHSIDPASVGLADFGRPQGFLERQVRRWTRQLESSHSRDLAGADELIDLLRERLPEEQPPAIVHGDYRLDNLLVDGDHRVAAVLDWEMATLGDPLTDLGLLLVYQRLTRVGTALGNAADAPGYLTEEEMLAVYREVSGRDLADMGFYLGLASFKLAVILEGIHYRFSQGQTVGEGFDAIGSAVEPLIASGIAALRSGVA